MPNPKEKPKADAKQSETNIINIIQQMVSEGQSEESIISTLRDLGVEEDKAKRLMLLGQADTFALLRSEITKIVADDMEKEKQKMIEYIGKETDAAVEKAKGKIEKEIISDLQKYEKDITGESKTFNEQISDTVKKFAELSERVKEKLNELGEHVHKIEVDMDEMKLRGIGGRNQFIGLALMVIGIGFCAFALYTLYAKFQLVLGIDSMIMTTIIALIGISMLFVATLR